MKIILFYIFFFIINTIANPQVKLVGYKSNSNYELYRKEIKNSLRRLYDIQGRTVTLNGFSSDKADTSSDFFIYPRRRLDILFKDSLDTKPVIKCLEPLSFIIIQRSKEKVYEYNISDSTIAGPFAGVWSSYYLNLTASSNISNVSFIYTLEKDHTRRNGTMIYKNNSIIMFNNGCQVYTNIRDYLRNECGDIDNYIKENKNEKLLIMLKKAAFQNFNPTNDKDLEYFIKNNWVFYLMSCPKDTVNNVKKIVEDISIYSNASSKQKKEIGLRIQMGLKNKDKTYPNQSMLEDEKNLMIKFDQILRGNKSAGFLPSNPYQNIVFMQLNLYPLLYSILPHIQADHYFNHYLITQFQFRQVDLRIHQLISKPNNIDIGKKRDSYENYIRSIISN